MCIVTSDSSGLIELVCIIINSALWLVCLGQGDCNNFFSQFNVMLLCFKVCSVAIEDCRECAVSNSGDTTCVNCTTKVVSSDHKNCVCKWNIFYAFRFCTLKASFILNIPKMYFLFNSNNNILYVHPGPICWQLLLHVMSLL